MRDSETKDAVKVAPARGGRGAAAVSRRIIHVDMDAFFASVEQMDNPSLRGKPVAVGGDPAGRGVVAAASYEARVFGVRSAMPMSQAMRLCPQLLRVTPRLPRYVEISRNIRSILLRWTPLVEMLSLDEGYLDVSAHREPASEIAARIKTTVREEIGLVASAGVGPSKLVAKIASDTGKPDGLVVVKPSRVAGFLAPLPVSRLWGVGPVTGRKLEALGVRTISDLAAVSERRLAGHLSPALAASLLRMAHGQDDREVIPVRPTKSISSERTLPEDTRDIPALAGLLDRFASEIEAALRDEKLRAKTIVLKIRYADFTSLTRSRTLTTTFDDARTLARQAHMLLGRTGAGRKKVRLVGLGVTGLSQCHEPYQQPLFPP